MEEQKFEQFQAQEKLQFVEALASQFYNTMKFSIINNGEEALLTHLSPTKIDTVVYPFHFFEAAGYLRHYLKVFGIFLVGEEGYEAYDQALANSKFIPGEKVFKTFMKYDKVGGAHRIAKFESDKSKILMQMHKCFNALELCTQNYPTSDSLQGIPHKLEAIVTSQSPNRVFQISEALEKIFNGLTPEIVLEINEKIRAISTQRYNETH